MKNILFITWDGPQTNYLEGLFLPVLNGISKNDNVTIHIIQFTWADEIQIQDIREAVNKTAIKYVSYKVLRKPFASLGTALTLFKGRKVIKDYIARYNINTVLVRSTMPAALINLIRHKEFKLIYDADGLPIEERVDFSGLSVKSLQYKWLKKQEKNILISANYVITRTQKAIDYHINELGEKYRFKFSTVANGRDTNIFNYNEKDRSAIRKQLGIADNSKVFIYAGSLGKQYCWEYMKAIFYDYLKYDNNAFFVVLTGDINYISEDRNLDTNKIIVKRVPFKDVNSYMSAADLAFALREPMPSMIGVSPVKIGEYLLTGLPVIMSKGIGDTNEIIENMQDCFLFEHEKEDKIFTAVEWIKKISSENRSNIRNLAINHYSLEKSITEYNRIL